MNEVVDLPKGTVIVRVGVTSRLLDRTGTVHVAVVAPNLTKKELQLTALVLGLAEDLGASVDAALGLDRIRGLVPLQPSTQRAFKEGQRLRVHAKASWQSKDETLSGEVQIVGLAPLPGGLERPLKVTTDKKGQKHAVLDCILPLPGLAPGSYILRVVARLSSGDAASREVPFEIR